MAQAQQMDDVEKNIPHRSSRSGLEGIPLISKLMRLCKAHEKLE